jgi:hypothetical protein
VSGDSDTAPEEARRFLKIREGAVASGKPMPPRLDSLRYDKIAAALREHYTSTGSRDMVEAGSG